MKTYKHMIRTIFFVLSRDTSVAQLFAPLTAL